MEKIYPLETQNFRSARKLLVAPSASVYCLVGPGDSGKSTILIAIDLCIGARRSLAFGDAHFHDIRVNLPIVITVTLDDLPDEFLNSTPQLGFAISTLCSADEGGEKYACA